LFCPVVNFLKYVVTEFLVKFLLLRHLLEGGIMTHYRCGGIFSDNIIID